MPVFDFPDDLGLYEFIVVVGIKDCELIAKVFIERFKPVLKRNFGVPLFVSDDDAVVDIHHVRTFHERMTKVSIGGVQRMVDKEGARQLVELTCNVYATVKKRADRYVRVRNVKTGSYACIL